MGAGGPPARRHDRSPDPRVVPMARPPLVGRVSAREEATMRQMIGPLLGLLDKIGARDGP